MATFAAPYHILCGKTFHPYVIKDLHRNIMFHKPRYVLISFTIGQPRMIGLVMIPGKHILSISADQDDTDVLQLLNEYKKKR